MAAETYLIVEQQPRAIEEMPQLLKELAADFKLDSYSCRQLLLGPGQALIAKGEAERLSEIRACLHSYQIVSQFITPSRPSFSPFILSNLEVGADALKFSGRDKSLAIQRASRVLILLAELSGRLVEKSLSQILADHRYRGTARNGALELEKWRKTILQGRPVLDIYLLNETGSPTGAVRAFPGKFNPQGLGERATLSANQNLLQLIKLTQEFAPASRVDMRFGLSPLPGAKLEPAKENDLDGLKKNLRSLTRYGWLQADIDGQQQVDQDEDGKAAEATTLAAVLTATQPKLGASLAAQPEILTTLTAAMNEGTQEQAQQQDEQEEQKAPMLPTPPDAQRQNIWSDPRTIAGFVGMGGIALIVRVGSGQHWLGPAVAKAFASGGFTTFFALGFAVAGFRLLQLKRVIENTPTSKIRSVAMGQVEIHGNARRQYALFSPMTNIPCIYYRLVRYKKNQKNNWVVSSITSSGHVPFWLEDDTGRVSIDPTSAKVKAEHRQKSMNHGGASFGGSYSADEKWVEEMIYDGAPVYILGEAQVKKGKRAPRQQRRGEALRRLKQDQQQMAKYDTNGDGHIDSDEWQAARDDVDAQLLHEDLADSAERKQQEDLVVIGKPRQRGIPFVIAEAASETKLTQRYAVSMVALFTLATGVGGISLWLFLRF